MIQIDGLRVPCVSVCSRSQDRHSIMPGSVRPCASPRKASPCWSARRHGVGMAWLIAAWPRAWFSDPLGWSGELVDGSNQTGGVFYERGSPRGQRTACPKRSRGRGRGACSLWERPGRKDCWGQPTATPTN
jgi:hypothetical protein